MEKPSPVGVYSEESNWPSVKHILAPIPNNQRQHDIFKQRQQKHSESLDRALRDPILRDKALQKQALAEMGQRNDFNPLFQRGLDAFMPVVDTVLGTAGKTSYIKSKSKSLVEPTTSRGSPKRRIVSSKTKRKNPAHFGDGTKAGTGIKGRASTKGKKPNKPRATFSRAIAPLAQGISTVKRAAKTTMVPGGVRVKNRELVVSSVNGSSSFSVQSTLSVNPGLQASFPWLYAQANQYETYKVHSLKLHYIPVTNATVTGSIMLIPDYDASDVSPSNELTAANNMGTVTGPVWEELVLILDPRSMMTPGPRKYIRNANVAGDLKVSDAATIFVTTVNCAVSSIVGKLWLEYDIEFFTPQTQTSASALAPKVTTELTATLGSFSSGVNNNIGWNAVTADPNRIVQSTVLVTRDTIGIPVGVWRLTLTHAMVNSTATTVGWTDSITIGAGIQFLSPRSSWKSYSGTQTLNSTISPTITSTFLIVVSASGGNFSFNTTCTSSDASATTNSTSSTTLMIESA